MFKVSIRAVLMILMVILAVASCSIIGVLISQAGVDSANEGADLLRSETVHRKQLEIARYFNEPVAVIHSLQAASKIVGTFNISDAYSFHPWLCLMMRLNGNRFTYFGTEIGTFAAAKPSPSAPKSKCLIKMMDARFSRQSFVEYDFGAEGIPESMMNSPQHFNKTSREFGIAKTGFDARQRPWYNASRFATAWSSVYLNWDKLFAVTTVGTPFYDPLTARKVGVFATDFTTDFLVRYLNENVAAKTGKMVLVESASKTVIGASWNESAVIKTKTETNDCGDFRNETCFEFKLASLGDMKRESMLLEALSHLGEQYFYSCNDEKNEGEDQVGTSQHDVRCKTVVGSGRDRVFVDVIAIKDAFGLELRLIILIPESDFLAHVWSRGDLAAVIASVVVAVLIAASIAIMYGVLKPLKEVEKRLRDSAVLNDYTTADDDMAALSHFTEIANIQEAHAKMAEQLMALRGFVPQQLLHDLQFAQSMSNSVSWHPQASLSTNPMQRGQSPSSSPTASSQQDAGFHTRVGTGGKTPHRSTTVEGEAHANDQLTDNSDCDDVSPLPITGKKGSNVSQGAKSQAVTRSDVSIGFADDDPNSLDHHRHIHEGEDEPEMESLGELFSLSGQNVVSPSMMTLNVDRVNAKVNTFRAANATMLVIDYISGVQPTPANMDTFAKDTEKFMCATIPHILRAKGVIEHQRPDHIVATFDRGVHVERAADCALKIAKSIRKRHMEASMVIHTGSVLTGACGARGRNAFVVASNFFRKGLLLAELSHRCLGCPILATDAVARSLPVHIAATPVDRISTSILTERHAPATSPSSTTSKIEDVSGVVLFELSRRRQASTQQQCAVKQVFAFMVSGDYQNASKLAFATLSENNDSANTQMVEPQYHQQLARLGTLSTGLQGNTTKAGYLRHYSGWERLEKDVSSHLHPDAAPEIGAKLTQQHSHSRYSGNQHLSSGDDEDEDEDDEANPALTATMATNASFSSSSNAKTVQSMLRQNKEVQLVSFGCGSFSMGEDDGGSGGGATPATTAGEKDCGGHGGLFEVAVESPRGAEAQVEERQQRHGTNPLEDDGAFLDAHHDGLTISQHQHMRALEMELTALEEVPSRFTDVRGLVWFKPPNAPRLGEGTFSKVYQGMNAQGDIVALKCINVEGRHFAGDDALVTEVNILTEINHRNLASFISVAVHESTVILIMEYVAGGTLRNVIKAYNRLLPRPATKRFAQDILSGLEYLHERNVMHGDIKPENVLLGADSICKLTDFGSAVIDLRMDSPKLTASGNWESGARGHHQQDVGVDDQQPDLRGTAPYMAPEVARGSLPTAASDMWSFGILFHEMITGSLPWAHENENVTKSQLKLIRGLAKQANEPGALRPRISIDLSSDLPPLPLASSPMASRSTTTIDVEKRAVLDLLRDCLQEDPALRPTAKQLLMHGYFL